MADLTTLQKTIASQCIFRSSDTRIVSSSGAPQSWLVDLKSILMSPHPLTQIASGFWDHFAGKMPFQVGGMEFSAVPIITAIVIEGVRRGHDVNGFAVRKGRKTTGLGKSIEGTITADPIVIVDDIVNSGKSLEKVFATLQDRAADVLSVFCIIDYENNQARAWSMANDTPIHSLLKLSQFDLLSTPASQPDPKVDYRVLWKSGESAGNPFHIVPKSAPLVHADRVFMGAEDGVFRCNDLSTGDEVWAYATGTTNPKGIWSSPAQHDGHVYFGGYDGNLYCLDAVSGTPVWVSSTSEYIGSSPCVAEQAGIVLIGLENDTAGRRGANAAFDLVDGSLVWADPLTALQHGSAAYDPATNRAFFGTCDDSVIAYDAASGKRLWVQDTGGPVKSAPALSPDGTLLAAASFDGAIYVFATESGDVVTRFQTGGPLYTTPLFNGDAIYFGSNDRHFYKVQPGVDAPAKCIDAKSKIVAPPCLVDGAIVVGTLSGTLLELDPNDLSLRASPVLPDAITNAVGYGVGHDLLIVATAINDVFALRRE